METDQFATPLNSEPHWADMSLERLGDDFALDREGHDLRPFRGIAEIRSGSAQFCTSTAPIIPPIWQHVVSQRRNLRNAVTAKTDDNFYENEQGIVIYLRRLEDETLSGETMFPVLLRHFLRPQAIIAAQGPSSEDDKGLQHIVDRRGKMLGLWKTTIRTPLENLDPRLFVELERAALDGTPTALPNDGPRTPGKRNRHSRRGGSTQSGVEARQS
uniref:Uncharacterized protein n=1 Tax=Parascaris univalens TaxID=6257 RepID=A0A914ZYU1_PARUN